VPDKDPKGRKVHLLFVINGQTYPVEAIGSDPLLNAVRKALAESGNTGRPAEEWEVRDIQGVLLPPGRSPEELGLKDGTRLFLSLQVGAGGFGEHRSRS
jgi:hypothetical protein